MTLFASLSISAQEPADPTPNQQLVGTAILTALQTGLPLFPGASAEVELLELDSIAKAGVADENKQTVKIEVVSTDPATTTFDLDGNKVHIPTSALSTVKDHFKNQNLFQLARPETRTGINYKSALAKTTIFNIVVNTQRFIAEPDTRHATLNGKYFSRYVQNIKNQTKLFRYTDATKQRRKINWTDWDTFETNIFKHGVEGHIFAQFWCDADPKCKTAEFGFTKNYLKNGIWKPFVGSFVSSLLFEMAPIFSESGIGHPAVEKGGPRELPPEERAYGFQDLILTPAIGALVLRPAADAYEKYIVDRFDRREVRKLNHYSDYVKQVARDAKEKGTPIDLQALEIESRRANPRKVLGLAVRALNVPKILSRSLEGDFKSPFQNKYILPGGSNPGLGRRW